MNSVEPFTSPPHETNDDSLRAWSWVYAAVIGSFLLWVVLLILLERFFA